MFLSLLPARAEETLYGGADLRREPQGVAVIKMAKIPVRAPLVPRFTVSTAEAERKMKSFAGMAAWNRNLIKQLKITLSHAETENERRIIGNKLASVTSSAMSSLALEDGSKSYYQALMLIDKNGFFKDASKAVTLFNRGQANGGADGNVNLYRGYALYDLKRYTEALSDFYKAMKNGRQDKHLFYHIGMCLFNQKKYADAADYFSRCLSIEDGYAESYYYRGLSYFRLGQFEKAVDDYNLAVFLDASLAKPY